MLMIMMTVVLILRQS